MLANRTNNQYPTTPVKNGHYYNDSAAGGNAVYGRSNGGRSMSIPGLSFNGDANLSVINTTLMNNGDNKDCGSSAVSRDGRSPTKRVESPISAGCGRHTARRAESPRHSTCKSHTQNSGMQIYSSSYGNNSTRHTWLNNNILNNNSSSKNSLSCDSDKSSTGSEKQRSKGCPNCSSSSRGTFYTICNSCSSKNNGGKISGGSILRAISVGRISSKQDKYFSSKDGALCISVHDK